VVFIRAGASGRVLTVLLMVLGGLFLATVSAIFLAPPERTIPAANDFFWQIVALGAGLGFLGVLFYALLREVSIAGLAQWLFVVGLGGIVLFYGLFFTSLAPYWFRFLSAAVHSTVYALPQFSDRFRSLQTLCLTVGGVFALLTVALWFVPPLAALRWRRIWALTRLTCIEVIRNRITWAFAFVALLFLFAPWFINAGGAEVHGDKAAKLGYIRLQDEVYTWTQIFYLVMGVLLLITTSLVAAFGIHNDIRAQTIQTVVTKPVERYEIVLGRFLGYTLLMTVGLFALTSLSLVYVLRGIDTTAQEKYLKARVPIYGSLRFLGTANPDKGENVGEEWEYRGYISGPNAGQPPQYAVWSLPAVPRQLANRDRPVPCEFTFSIYRTTTGDIRGGVLCAIEMRSWRWLPTRQTEYSDRVKNLPSPSLTESERQLPSQEQERILKARWAPWNRLTAVYGFFSVPSIRVTNGETQMVAVPPGLFRGQQLGLKELEAFLGETKTSLADKQKERDALGAGDPIQVKQLDEEIKGLQQDEKVLAEDVARAPELTREPLQVWVQCTDRTQFLGMAKYDLYLLDSEQPFWLNFYKGVTGIWLFNVLVIALGVCFSTTLNGVVSWLVAMWLIGIGATRDYAQKVAEGTNEGGGPAEAWLKLINGQMPSGVLEETTTKRVAGASDEVFRWGFRNVLDLFPDISRLDFGDRVSNGFDVPFSSVLVTGAYIVLPVLVVLAVISYFLIKSREIASSS
jgi:hypothetical protein